MDDVSTFDENDVPANFRNASSCSFCLSNEDFKTSDEGDLLSLEEGIPRALGDAAIRSTQCIQLYELPTLPINLHRSILSPP